MMQRNNQGIQTKSPYAIGSSHLYNRIYLWGTIILTGQGLTGNNHDSPGEILIKLYFQQNNATSWSTANLGA